MNASYLQQINFDSKLNNGFIARYLRNPRLVILLILMIILVGVSSLMSLPRVLNPDIKIPLVIVSTVLPGAGPKDIESLVTVPLEDAVNGVANVKTVTSSSQDSVSVIQVEFNSGTDPDKAKSDIQSAVDSVNTLPSDTQKSSVQKLDFQNTPVWTFVLSGDTDPASLNSFAHILRDKLKDLPNVDHVTTNGLDTQEVQILIPSNVFATYQINPQQLTQQIGTAIHAFPAGSISTNASLYALSIDQQATMVENLRKLTVNIANTPVPLSDIASVSQRAKPDEQLSFFATSTKSIRRGVTFSIFKTSTSSIDQAVSESKKLIDDTLPQYHNQFTIDSVFNTSEQIDRQFSDLIRDFTITVLLVFATLFIFLGIRQALVALLAMPLTFFITFTVMHMTGISLSFIAIFSLLLSLGLLVDDTIVVISAMTAYFRTGKFTPSQTGLLVWRDFILAIFTTTITTVWAFLPLLLATGIIGDFIKAIPIVVSTSLLSSFFVAMLITLPVFILILQHQFPRRVRIFLVALVILTVIISLFSLLPKGPLFLVEMIALASVLFIFFTARKEMSGQIKQLLGRRVKNKQTLTQTSRYLEHGLIHFELVAMRYRAVMRRILLSKNAKRKVVAMVIIFSLFSYLLLPLGFVRNEFFPKSDADFVYVTVELPAGTNVQTTTGVGKELLEKLRHTPGISFVTLDVGQGVSQGGGISGGSSNNIALFSLELLSKEKRTRSSIDIAQDLRQKYGTYTKGTLQVVEESGGPPAGADVQIKLFGDDLTLLDQYANQVEHYLQTQPGTTNIDKSIKPGTSKIIFTPDQARMSQAGVTLDQVSYWLRLFASGSKLGEMTLDSQGSDKFDITLRMKNGTQSPESIQSIAIPTPNGNLTLGSLGTFSLSANPTLITRESGKRTISISASVSQGYSVSQINTNLTQFAQNKLNLPAGYSWSTGGVNQQNQESVTSILQAMLLSFLLIVITMVVQFSSFRKAIIVMLVIPLSIAGVFIMFALTHTPLSFPALIGVLALFGIVVKNAILIIDKINQNNRIGMSHIDAVIDGASSRLEAIALTSFATIMGLIPITLSDPLWRGLGGAIIAGLTFSGTIMLFFIPVVYYLWFGRQTIKK